MKDIRKVAAQTKNLPYRDVSEGMYDVCEQDWWSEIGSAEYPFEDTPVTDVDLDMGVHESDMAEHAAKDSSYVISGGHHNSWLTKERNAAKLPLAPEPLPENEDLQEAATREDLQPTMSSVLKQVRRQYFDTLYLAKVCCSYAVLSIAN